MTDPSTTSYRKPPAEVVTLLDAPPTPWVSLSPDTRWMLYVEHASMPTLADLAHPMLRLAGLRIDPATNARHQTSLGTGMVLRDRGGEHMTRIELPAGRRIAAARWSHTGVRFACTLIGAEGTELWVASATDPRLRKLAGGINAIFGEGFDWMPDGRHLVFSRVPRERARVEPAAPGLPIGPVVQETGGETSPLRTFTDLLRDAHDEDVFEHYATAQVALVDADDADGNGPRDLGAAGIVLDVDPSPDGEHLLVTRVVRPFSYSLTVYGFPQRIEVWSRADGSVERVVAELGAAENIPIEGVRQGPRAVSWTPHAGARLIWAEALDGGDPRAQVPHRDRWMEAELDAGAAPREFLRLEHRASGLSWLRAQEHGLLAQEHGLRTQEHGQRAQEHGQRAHSRVLAREYDRERRWMRCWSVDVADAQAPRVLLDDRSLRDRYLDPGTILLERDEHGRRIVRQRGAWIFRSGEGAAEQGARPFLDRQNLETLEVQRLWRCAADAYETPIAIANDGADTEDDVRFVTRHESPREPPNLRLRSSADASWQALTEFPDPMPQLRGITKELVTYTREDGVGLSGTLYLPAGHDPKVRLPLVLWSYPHDYVDADTAGQVRGSAQHFTTIRGASHLFFLTQGYAVLDGASMPIIGDPETMNNSFLEQTISSARAAIRALADRGIVDPERVGVGGHSYGAFMTVQLLAHSDLFRAGIARSGAYNRTLTPFGFQSERRTLWQARTSYVELSPFMYADRIKAPLLLIHGAQDSNPGTFPMQSERLFHAIKGTGGTARYVSLPHESHGYRARESILHVLAEMIEWFDKYVKAPS